MTISSISAIRKGPNRRSRSTATSTIVSISDSSCEEQADTGGGKDVKEVRGEEEKKEEVNVKKK